jgi:hypothetical protein
MRHTQVKDFLSKRTERVARVAFRRTTDLSQKVKNRGGLNVYSTKSTRG